MTQIENGGEECAKEAILLVLYLTWVVRCLGFVVSPLHGDGDGPLVPGVAVVGVGHLAHRHATGLQDLQYLVLVGCLGEGGDV